jgi:hypothetical protein
MEAFIKREKVYINTCENETVVTACFLDWRKLP